MKVRAGFGLPHLPADHPVRPILAAALARDGKPTPPHDYPEALWDASHFGLETVALFRGLERARQRRVLAACAEALLVESAFVEKGGLAFAGKMILLSESTDERMLYALLAADEARHLHWIRGFLQEPDFLPPGDAFVDLLAEVVESVDKPGLTYVVQVVLEGWGLTHYDALARGCRDHGLAAVLRQIVRDEALHHAGGVALFRAEALGPGERDAIVGVLLRLLRLVQAGPQSVVRALEAECGPLTIEERRCVFRELEAEAHADRRLRTLRNLIAVPGAAPILDALEHHQAFRPFEAEECARA